MPYGTYQVAPLSKDKLIEKLNDKCIIMFGEIMENFSFYEKNSLKHYDKWLKEKKQNEFFYLQHQIRRIRENIINYIENFRIMIDTLGELREEEDEDDEDVADYADPDKSPPFSQRNLYKIMSDGSRILKICDILLIKASSIEIQ
jgi:hypothetical protein